MSSYTNTRERPESTAGLSNPDTPEFMDGIEYATVPMHCTSRRSAILIISAAALLIIGTPFGEAQEPTKFTVRLRADSAVIHTISRNIHSTVTVRRDISQEAEALVTRAPS